MLDVIDQILFSKDNRRFREIEIIANNALKSYCGDTIIRDRIFNSIRTYAKIKDLPIEILRFPIQDNELWAFTFLKKGVIFVCINTALSVCKQIFAAAHEFYHIICYVEDTDQNSIRNGSMLHGKDEDDIVGDQEEIEANAFAGLLLAPSNSINEQIRIYGIDTKNIDIKAIIRLMDIYAIPFKAMVLRLFEEKLIDEKIAESFIEQNTSESVKDAIKKYNTALRWQERTETVDLGDLPELINENQLTGSLPHTRTDEDKQTIHSIKKALMAT